ncbi:exopolysaccharide biosynthesis polyprenyl glycosylphosphotransferase [Sphingomonas sp. BGYR3]|uniref:exopolysaccharide biosynthesis polyprenyl glycosylphosphotransferase n=1 Tax=Sphingomonas sp. BGYR3 TaxID=2975483 RepID=UPI0021A8D143|nr:exopolysaccharide biosynthesis polyprenyl glycosylphosphotransferase [Sphingomonas sp. BGYR3]MDG5488548.1 exopolysaccharide biosynthesis polyprenyl glycosylphosphotransferase [Sphingomonas sp. BGYR3]
MAELASQRWRHAQPCYSNGYFSSPGEGTAKPANPRFSTQPKVANGAQILHEPFAVANSAELKWNCAVSSEISSRYTHSIRVTENTTSKHGIRVRLVVLLGIIDFIAICIGPIATAWLYMGNVGHPGLPTLILLIVPMYYLSAVRQKTYRPVVIISPRRSARRACLSIFTALMLFICFTFAVKSSDVISRVIAIGGTLVSCGFLVLFRRIFASYAFHQLDGSPESEVVLIENYQAPEGCTALKIDLTALGIRPDINDPVMLDRLGQVIHETDRVIVACQPERRPEWALALKGAGVNVEVLTPELDAIGTISATRYCGIATTPIAIGPLNAVDRLIKRLFDLAITIPALIILSPLMILVAILIRLDSPGSILFVQPRIGQGNRMFRMFKFRSMRNDLLDHNASKLTARNDARVTRIGSIIRKTSIDELPQLLNVLRGDMSIVGPRPHATGALAGDALYWEVSSQYWSRHAVKPGLTGLAQVRGFRGNTETGDDLINRLNADLIYLESWSIWRDISIVFQTFRVLVHRNAF